jgi:hypothetical protein
VTATTVAHASPGDVHRDRSRASDTLLEGRFALKLKLIVSIAALVAGCSTASKAYDKDGQQILVINCGAGTSMSICHDRAMSECPQGYSTVSEDNGFNRKELRVRCKSAQSASPATDSRPSS